MRLLRFLSVTALGLWVGGLATLGAIAAPVTFAVLEARDAASGRSAAGELFGAIITRFEYAALALGGVVLAITLMRYAERPRPPRLVLRGCLAAGMLAATLVTALVLAPRIEMIRQQTVGAVASLPADDPARRTFGMLHGLSSGLMLATLAAGVGLLWLESAPDARGHS